MLQDVLDASALLAPLSSAELGKAAVIVAVEVLLLTTSLLSILVISTTPDLYDVIGIYFMSLSVADLLNALLIVPLSIYASLDTEWRFTGDNEYLCKCAAYIQIALFCSTVYTFAWICIDRYAAMMKPARYSDQSLTRCKCWIVFSWITSVLICSPIVFAQMQVDYNRDIQLCVLNWGATSAYSYTLLVLVFVPTIVTVANTGYKILTAFRSPHALEDSQRSIVETDPNFGLTLFVLVSFVLSWTPLILLKSLVALYPNVFGPEEYDLSLVNFIFVWFAIAGPSAKFLIYMWLNKTFRQSLLSSWSCLACCIPRARARRRSEYANISNSSYL